MVPDGLKHVMGSDGPVYPNGVKCSRVFTIMVSDHGLVCPTGVIMVNVI